MLPGAHPSPTGSSIGSAVIAQLTSVSSGTSQNCPFPWGIWTPVYYVVPWAHLSPQPNGISIGSAVFAGLTAVTDRQTTLLGLYQCGLIMTSGQSKVDITPHRRRKRTVQSYSPGGANVTSQYCASFGPPESTAQTANRSVQPFLHSSRRKVPTLYIGRPFPPKLPLLVGGGISTPSNS